MHMHIQILSYHSAAGSPARSPSATSNIHI